MLKICGNSIYKPLEIIFRQALLTGIYPLDWKKGNIVPVQKKRDKQNIKNYRPISLLRICGIIFNKMFRIFVSNNLNSLNQSGFKPGDSCINHLSSITPKIYKLFDGGLKVTGVFLDISKAFDKLWHQGLIFKLKQNGISGDLLHILSDFLSYRKQKVVINGRKLPWTNVHAGAPRVPSVGSLLLLIYINDLVYDLPSNVKLLMIHLCFSSSRCNWAFQWKMGFNPEPSKQTQEVIFSRKIKKLSHSSLVFSNNNVLQASSQKLLGVTLDVKLTFDKHLNNVLNKVNKTIGLLCRLQNLL